MYIVCERQNLTENQDTIQLYTLYIMHKDEAKDVSVKGEGSGRASVAWGTDDEG